MTWNQACSFAGSSSSYIAVPHSSSLDITGSFTIEAWVNPVNVGSPSAQIILQKRLAGNNGYTLYLTSGKVAIRTNSSTRLIGKTAISNNQWTHIAGSYSSSSGTFRVFINGVQDTTTTVASANPTTNSDSVLIGVGSNNPFNGKMDEIRIWNLSFVETDIQQLMRLSLGTNSGYYSGLVMSLNFQNANGSGTLFTLNDACGNNNNGVNRGVGALNLSNQPSSLISINECITMDGTGDYLSAPDHSAVSPVSGITLSAWVYPKSFNVSTSVYSTIIHKGTPNGSVTDYRMEIQKKQFRLYINETNVFGLSTSGEFFPLDKWTHFAISYSGSSGFIKFYLNGVIRWDDTNFVGNVHNNTDSLYIGGTPNLQCFDGFIDEVKIAAADLNPVQITDYVYSSVNETNDPSSTNVAFNFDGGLVSNSDTGPRLTFRGNSHFSQNANTNNSPVSPMTCLPTGDFSEAYYLSNAGERIPASGTSGFMTSDTIDVPLNENITDINVFVALNHTDEDNLVISLISPSGTSVILYNTTSLINNSDNLCTIFDDQAVSALSSNTYVMYSPSVVPENSINSVFSGTNTKGKWKLKIQDVAASDTGTLYGWGIRFNNQSKRKSVLSLKALIQGFYDPATNLMIPDTMSVSVRSNVSPYASYETQKAKLNDSGKADFVFNNVPDGVPVFIQLNHRNLIETWSKKSPSSIFTILNSISFNPFLSYLSYDFTTSASQAFGLNQKLVDTVPNKFAAYNGDENQDDIIDAADLIDIYNDVNNVVSGYVKTDLTGDDFVDASDLILGFNNSNDVVEAVIP